MALALLLRFSAAVAYLVGTGFALNLIRITGRWRVWLAMALALGLLGVHEGVRTTLMLAGAAARGAGGAHVLALVPALLAAAAMASLGPMWRRAARAADALTESEQRFRELFEKAPLAYQSLDRQARLIDVNQAWLALTGYARDEVIGRRFPEFLAPASVPLFEERFPQFMAAGVVRDVEWELAQKGGTLVRIRLNGRIAHDEDGRFRQTHCILADITEEARREAKHALLTSAIEQAAESVVITDAAGMITYVNPAFEKLTGYSRAEALGENPRLLKSGRHGAAFYEEMWATLTRGETWSGHIVNRRKDGTFFEEDAVISPIRDGAGTTVSYVAVKKDVTHERDIEDRLRQAERVESLGHFAGGIAHDFNNLLMAILGSTELLQQRLSVDDASQVQLGTIKRTAERAAELTRGMLAFARRQVLDPVDLDLGELVGGMLPMLRRLIPEDISVDHIPGHELGTVRADRGQMEQILLNLCLNARDAMPHGGTITIETENVLINGPYVLTHPWAKQGRYVLLSVTDAGTGMDPETLSHVFEPFFTTKEQGKGTGLGLATVYGIVKQHHGMIHAYSEPGRGTTFKVYLPVVERRALAVDTKINGPVLGGDETILVVEDEAEVRQVLVEVLSSFGYRVLEATDGSEALEVIRREAETLKLVLTDVVMPRMGGKDLCQAAQQIAPHVLFLFSSGYTENVVHDGFIKKTSVQFIAKPYGIDTLARKVREVLDSR
jgi:two-component system cell cycle sensor histidine kinase/response regulator CckA